MMVMVMMMMMMRCIVMCIAVPAVEVPRPRGHHHGSSGTSSRAAERQDRRTGQVKNVTRHRQSRCRRPFLSYTLGDEDEGLSIHVLNMSIVITAST